MKPKINKMRVPAEHPAVVPAALVLQRLALRDPGHALAVLRDDGLSGVGVNRGVGRRHLGRGEHARHDDELRSNTGFSVCPWVKSCKRSAKK